MYTQKRLFIWISLGIICCTSFLLMWNAASQESPIVDELAHIPAGYSYVHELDYRLNPEHPPLLKALSGLFLLPLSPDFSTTHPSWITGINDQWRMGLIFFLENVSEIDTIVATARLVPMLFMIGLIIMTFFLARRVMDEIWALFPSLFVAFSPHFLAHGHYVTTDVPLAFGIVLALFFFLAYLQEQKKRNLLYAGITLGIALLLKFSALILLPLFFFGGGIYVYVHARSGEGSKKWLGSIGSWVGSFLKIGGIALLLIIIVYTLFTINLPPEKQSYDTSFLLTRYLQHAPYSLWECPGVVLSCVADVTQELSDVPLVRSLAHYVTGILMVSERSAYGNPVYFFGEIGTGWWYYFPVVFLLKEPLPLIFVILWGMWVGVKRLVQNRKRPLSEYILLRTPEFFMTTFVLVYGYMSIQSALNIGFRHILPVLPFVYILSVSSLYRGYKKKEVLYRFALTRLIREKMARLWPQPKTIRIILLSTLSGVLILETILVSPHFLSYFNELGGGVWNGWKYVVDSNYDWGQDLLGLETFVKEHDIERIAVDYFGGGSPSFYINEAYVPWTYEDPSPADQGIEWFVASIHNLQLYRHGSQKGYQWLSSIEYPYTRIGTSLFVFRLPLVNDAQ